MKLALFPLLLLSFAGCKPSASDVTIWSSIPSDKEQLLIYQMAAEQALGMKVNNLQFYYLDNNNEINFLGSEEEIAKIITGKH